MKNAIFDIDWQYLFDDLILNKKVYYKKFCTENKFKGPSKYFHIKALNTEGEEKAIMVYALLVSWGMHKMGGGPEMVDYEDFKASIDSVELAINSIKVNSSKIVQDDDITTVTNIYMNLKTMNSSKRIVGNSKALAHYLPNIICPIDGEYTNQFLFGIGNRNSPDNNKDIELFELFHENIVFKLIKNRKFKKFADKIVSLNKSGWDTSIPKVIDNLIIGKVEIDKEKSVDNDIKKFSKKIDKLLKLQDLTNASTL